MLVASVALALARPDRVDGDEDTPAAPPGAETDPAGGAGGAGAASFADPGFAYRDYAAFLEACRSLARGDGARWASVQSIGRSSLGRELVAIVVTDRQAKPSPEFRPAVLAVGNLHGDEVVGGEVAFALARSLVGGATSGDVDVRRLLGETTFYIVPRPNPDATELLFGRPARAEPLVLSPGRDDDRDHRRDEDPPDDLDEDGVVLQIRIPGDREADWRVETDGDAENDRRLIRPVDRSLGEAGEFKLIPEGRDDDADRRDNEDGEWGIDLDRSFPIEWRPAHQTPHAGQFSLQAPEARALADFVLAHRNVAVALCWSAVGPKAGVQPVASGQIKPEGDDAKLYEHWKKRYTELTEGEAAPNPFHAGKADDEKAWGSFQDWLYGGLGIFSWSIRVFDQPPALPAPDEGDDESEGGEDEAKKKKDVAKAPIGRRWLAWDDAVQGGAGFREWSAIRHPRYEGAEVGGWMPLAGRNPPPAIGEEIAGKQIVFVRALADSLPRVRIAEVEIDPLEGDLYRVEIVIENAGALPIPTEMARRTRRGLPTVLQAAPGGGDRIVLGKERHVVGSLDAGGGKREISFIMRAERGGKAPLRLLLSSPRGGVDAKEVWVGKEF